MVHYHCITTCMIVMDERCGKLTQGTLGVGISSQPRYHTHPTRSYHRP